VSQRFVSSVESIDASWAEYVIHAKGTRFPLRLSRLQCAQQREEQCRFRRSHWARHSCECAAMALFLFDGLLPDGGVGPCCRARAKWLANVLKVAPAESNKFSLRQSTLSSERCHATNSALLFGAQAFRLVSSKPWNYRTCLNSNLYVRDQFQIATDARRGFICDQPIG
jgi:hypothetical protein